jgi:DnaJ-domain-containing protein 1
VAEPDPHTVLGLSPEASEAEVRAAYRQLAQRLHPDHNGGSPEAARRFTELHAAYVKILEGRRVRATTASAMRDASDLESRIAAIEAELREARAAREAAHARAAEAVQDPRPTPEELCYVTTEDSLTKILDDAGAGLSRRLGRWLGDHRP